MKVKDLYNVISPFQNLQIADSKTAEPLTFVSYIADSGCEITNYEEYEIYGIAPKKDKEGDLYLAILIVMEM